MFGGNVALVTHLLSVAINDVRKTSFPIKLDPLFTMVFPFSVIL
jgi:hypothetical protein